MSYATRAYNSLVAVEVESDRKLDDPRLPLFSVTTSETGRLPDGVDAGDGYAYIHLGGLRPILLLTTSKDDMINNKNTSGPGGGGGGRGNTGPSAATRLSSLPGRAAQMGLPKYGSSRWYGSTFKDMSVCICICICTYSAQHQCNSHRSYPRPVFPSLDYSIGLIAS